MALVLSEKVSPSSGNVHTHPHTPFSCILQRNWILARFPHCKMHPRSSLIHGPLHSFKGCTQSVQVNTNAVLLWQRQKHSRGLSLLSLMLLQPENERGNSPSLCLFSNPCTDPILGCSVLGWQSPTQQCQQQDAKEDLLWISPPLPTTCQPLVIWKDLTP